MRIAVWHNLPSGGGKRALSDQVRGLRRRGHDIEIWCPSSADRTYQPTADLAPEHVLPLRWNEVSATRSTLAERIRWTLLDRTRNLAELERHCRACAEQINRGHFDVFVAHSSLFLAVAPIARFIQGPRVLYLQEPFRVLYEAMPQWPYVTPELPASAWAHPLALVEHFGQRVRVRHFQSLAREEARNISAYHLVLANSLYSRESILRAYGVNARTCYLGVDTDRFVDRRLPRDRYVIGVGSFTPAKNIEFVVRALAHAREPRPRLVWIGNSGAPGYLDRIRAMAASLSVEFDARTLVSDEELVDALNRASAAVYAPRLEPFGFAPLEANACGLPIVAVAEGGIRETVVDGVNGLLTEEDERAFAAAVDRLVSDPALRLRLGDNGRRMVLEHWSQEAAVERLEARLLEAIETAGASAPPPPSSQREGAGGATR